MVEPQQRSSAVLPPRSSIVLSTPCRDVLPFDAIGGSSPRSEPLELSDSEEYGEPPSHQSNRAANKRAYAHVSSADTCTSAAKRARITDDMEDDAEAQQLKHELERQKAAVRELEKSMAALREKRAAEKRAIVQRAARLQRILDDLSDEEKRELCKMLTKDLL